MTSVITICRDRVVCLRWSILRVMVIAVYRAVVAVAAGASDGHQCCGRDRRVDQQQCDKTRASSNTPVKQATAVARRIHGNAHGPL